MDYDTVISSAETTIGMVEAIRRSLAEQAGAVQLFQLFQSVAHNDHNGTQLTEGLFLAWL